MRTIAKRAGLSSTAVSLALRNHPRISRATRELVKKIAGEVGYNSDPYVARLMAYLGARRKSRYQSMICALTTIPEDRTPPYVTKLIASAKQRAETLGHGFTLIRVSDLSVPRRDLQRILRARGVDGLLILPLLRPLDCRAFVDWNDYSVVAAASGVLAPQFHRVVPHQFANMLAACQRLKEYGYKRIGLVQTANHDLTVNHNFSAAVSWQNLLGGTEFIMPFIYSDEEESSGQLEHWFAREYPDVIIESGIEDEMAIARRLGLRIPGPVGFAVTSRAGSSQFAGVDERPVEIGTRAVDMLAAMIQRGEKGVPKVPMVTMIEGGWTTGRSIRRQTKRTAGNSDRRSKAALRRSSR